MKNKRVLSRLLRLRELEEEQSRLQLERAAREREIVARAEDSAGERLRAGRSEAISGASRGDALRRMAGQAEAKVGQCWQDRLASSVRGAEAELIRQREEFLLRRTDRRQVEMLAQAEERTHRESMEKQAQRMLDDWFGQRRQARSLERKSAQSTAAPVSNSPSKQPSVNLP